MDKNELLKTRTGRAYNLQHVNPLDPTEISENPSEILGKSLFFCQIWVNLVFHNNLFNIEYLSLQVMFILINIELPTKWYRTPLCMLHI